MLNNIFESERLGPCVAKNGEDLVKKINRLYEDQEFYRQLQDIGRNEYSKRTVDAVSDELINILFQTLNAEVAK